MGLHRPPSGWCHSLRKRPARARSLTSLNFEAVCLVVGWPIQALRPADDGLIDRFSLAAIRVLEAFFATSSSRRESSSSDQSWERRELVPGWFTASPNSLRSSQHSCKTHQRARVSHIRATTTETTNNATTTTPSQNALVIPQSSFTFCALVLPLR